MTTHQLEVNRIQVRIDAETCSVWIEPSRALFGRTRVRRAAAGFQPGDELVADRVDWKIIFTGGSEEDLLPVLLFESFDPEPEGGSQGVDDLRQRAESWDRRLGPCASIERQGDVLEGRGLASEQNPVQDKPRGLYRYTFGLIPRQGGVISVKRLWCAHGLAAGLQPPPEPIGRSG